MLHEIADFTKIVLHVLIPLQKRQFIPFEYVVGNAEVLSGQLYNLAVFPPEGFYVSKLTPEFRKAFYFIAENPVNIPACRRGIPVVKIQSAYIILRIL